MLTPLPLSEYDKLLLDAAERGKEFRNKGGTFKTTQGIRDGSHMLYYKVLYPPARYDDKGILIPTDPVVTDILIGFETIDESATSVSAPSKDLQQHVWQEQDLRHPVPA